MQRLWRREIAQRTRASRPDPAGDTRAQVAARLRSVLGDSLSALEGCDRDELAQRLRLVQMLLVRLERMRDIGGDRDLAIESELAPWRARVDTALRERSRTPEQVRALRRMWEEIEISRFAPKLPRAFPASERRLEEMLGG